MIGSSLELSASVEVFAEQCAEGQIDSVVLNVRDQGDLEWSSSELNLDGELIDGEMLISDEGVKKISSLSGLKLHRQHWNTSGRAWINPFQIYFGHVEEIYCTDFETDDAGFTHQLVAGQEQEAPMTGCGASQWALEEIRTMLPAVSTFGAMTLVERSTAASTTVNIK